MTTIPTVTEGDLLAAIVAEYRKSQIQPGDISAFDIMALEGVKYDKANDMLNVYWSAHPDQVTKENVRIPGRKGRFVVLRRVNKD